MNNAHELVVWMDIRRGMKESEIDYGAAPQKLSSVKVYNMVPDLTEEQVKEAQDMYIGTKHGR